MNALRLCLGLLTVVPVGPLPRVDRRSARAAMLLAPLAAVPLAVLVVLAHLLVRHTDTPAPVVATLLVAAGAGLTRGMHLDGLADAADGLGAGGGARGLDVMKASDIGPFGVITLVFVLLLQVTCLAWLLPDALGTFLAVVALLVSRQVLAHACRTGVPAARPGSLGALVAGTVETEWAALGTVLLAGTSGFVGVAVGADTDWWQGPLVTVVAALVALGFLSHCVRRFGGVTGDVLGATVEVALVAGLVGAVLVH